MEQAQNISAPGQDDAVSELVQLRHFPGPPNTFWPAFLAAAAGVLGARHGELLLQGDSGSAWRRLTVWPAGRPGAQRSAWPDAQVQEIANEAVRSGYAMDGLGKTGSTAKGEAALGIRLKLGESRESVAVFTLDQGADLSSEDAAVKLHIISETPFLYQQDRITRQARSDVAQFSEALDLMVLLNAEKRYMAAAMTFCNELASRYRCDRVGFGWLKGSYVRLQAVSHMERFEKKMDVVQALEAVMEEAFDQDEEVVWPRPGGSTAVVRDHEAFGKEHGTAYIVSLPLRLDDKSVGVVTCERSQEPFSEEDVRGLRVLCDQSARRLGDLQQRDRWFGARAASAAKDALSGLFGVEHTFAKLMGILISLALAFLIFGKLTYRVEAPFILKTDDLAYIPSPFDGYIYAVNVKVGDAVDKDEPLLSLDISDLLLEESIAIANQNRYSREAEKARAQNALADMRVALALEAQAAARLNLVRYKIAHAKLKAPFTGIVVEGDLEELLGAPVKKGDVLFKVARIDKMYAELKVDERDIHEIANGATGEIAFVSRPDLKFPIGVVRIDPVAVTQEMENVFLLRAEFPQAVSRWWRPGMSGVAKVNVGKRNVLWIFTHRTIDFLRIFFWW